MTSPDFLIFLDSEIESSEENSIVQQLLVTIKLRILDEIGKSKGDDIMAIPRIASQNSVKAIKLKVLYVIYSKSLFDVNINRQ